MEREKLIRSKGYNVTKIQNELFRQLTEYLEVNNLTRTQFAKQLGVTKGYVSQILNGDFDYKISKLVELSLAIGKVPEVSFIPIQEAVKGRKKEMKVIHLAEKRIYNQSSTLPVNTIFTNNDLPEFKLAQ